MRVVVVGGTGMLGSMVVWLAQKRGLPLVVLPRSLDARTLTVADVLPHIQAGDTVINCIGAIPQRTYTDAEMFQLNAVFPHTLAAACELAGAHMVHISTNCVFAHSNARVDDRPDATDRYGRSKALGEPRSACVLRCSIIGLERTSAHGLLEWYLHAKETVRGYTDALWNGITTLELATYLLDGSLTPGVHHLTSPDVISKYDLLVLVRDLWGHVDIQPFVSNVAVHPTLTGTHITSPLHTQLVALKSIESEYTSL